MSELWEESASPGVACLLLVASCLPAACMQAALRAAGWPACGWHETDWFAPVRWFDLFICRYNNSIRRLDLRGNAFGNDGARLLLCRVEQGGRGVQE